jgi:hypothetical protein
MIFGTLRLRALMAAFGSIGELGGLGGEIALLDASSRTIVLTRSPTTHELGARPTRGKSPFTSIPIGAL